MPPMPAEAEAPPDLLTPLTARPASSARRAMASSAATSGSSRSTRSRSGKFLRQQRRIGEARHTCPRARRAPSPPRARPARRRRRRSCRWSRPPPACARPAREDPCRRPRSAAIPRPRRRALDRLRHRAHRHRVGGIGAGRAGSLDEPLGERDQGGLVEQGIHCGLSGLGGAWSSDKASNSAQTRLDSRAFPKFAPSAATRRQSCAANAAHRAINQPS